MKKIFSFQSLALVMLMFVCNLNVAKAADGWTSLGEAPITTYIFEAMSTGAPSTTYNIVVERNIENPKIYRIVEPFGTKCPFYNTIKATENMSYTAGACIQVDVTDPNNVTIAKQFTGWSLGPLAMNVVSTSPGKLVNGVITWPENTINLKTSPFMTIPERTLVQNGSLSITLPDLKWDSVGVAPFTECTIEGVVAKITTPSTYNVTVERNYANHNLYRVVEPFGTNWPYYNQLKQNYGIYTPETYLQVDITDPEKITLEKQKTGWEHKLKVSTLTYNIIHFVESNQSAKLENGVIYWPTGTINTTSEGGVAVVSYQGTMTINIPDAPSDVTIGAAGKATVYSDYNLVVPAGVSVYGMQDQGTYLNYSNTTPAEGDILPAKQGYIVEATPGTYHFATTTDSATVEVTSCLSGAHYSTPVSTITDGTVYTLDNGINGVGFYRFNGTNLAARKAFYVVSAPTTKEFIALGEETAIESLGIGVGSGSDGKYIENGRVVIVKNNKKFNTAGQRIK